MPRELTDQIASRNPCRKLEALTVRIRVHDRDADLEEVRVRIERDDVVLRGNG